MKKLFYTSLLVLLFIAVFTLTVSAKTYGDLSYEVSNGEVTITDCNISVTSVTIPEEINGYPVTSIGYKAFEQCTSLTSITIPNSVTSIGSSAFYGCISLVKVSISKESELKSIGSSAFKNCSSLSQITFSPKIQSVGSGAFGDCNSVQRVDIYDIASWCTLKYDGLWLFGGNSAKEYELYFNGELLENLVIPNGVTEIRNYAFCVCTSLTSVTIPDGMTIIGKAAFAGCRRLKRITIPDSVTSIGTGAFSSGCTNLKEVYITDIAAWCNISFADKYANPLYCGRGKLYVNEKKITELVMPSGIGIIKSYTFSGCSGITSLELSEDILCISAYAFSDCSNLKKVIIPSTTTLIAASAFSSSPEIHGFLGSEAESFAELKGYTFVPIDDIVYEITYNLSGGDGEVETGKKGVYADYSITDKIPTKRHCTFLGWSTEENGEVAYEAGDVYSKNIDLTLFAVWQEPQVVIDDITVTPGGSFYVDLVVENSVPIKAMTVNGIKYSDTLTLTDAEWLLKDSIFNPTINANGDSIIAFESAIDANKAVMRLYFTVDENIADQEAYVRFNAKGTDEENATFDIVTYEGKISIRNFVIGDCDGDEAITIDDAIHLAFYTFYADRYPIPNGMDVDFNNDGEVTIDDAIYLAFYTFYPDRYPIN
jgi:hypothetical protein